MADSALALRINTEIIAAMKTKDARRLGALRLVKTAIVNRGIAKGHDLDDAECLQVIGQLVKQSRDSIEQFAAAGRQDLVDKETAELSIIDGYLPPGASDAEIESAVTAAITETGATSRKDMGRVMKAVMSGLAGKTADGKAVSEAVKGKLSDQ
jgi:uncharacterized protein YqeY